MLTEPPEVAIAEKQIVHGGIRKLKKARSHRSVADEVVEDAPARTSENTGTPSWEMDQKPTVSDGFGAVVAENIRLIFFKIFIIHSIISFFFLETYSEWQHWAFTTLRLPFITLLLTLNK
jgi:hypothetical protein